VSHNGSGDAGMGVERRKGRLYLYARVRAGGQRRTAYLGPLTPAAALAFRRRRAAERRGADEARATGAVAAREAAAVLARGGEFDRLADRVFRAEMALGGFRLHKRSTWRKTRGGLTMTDADRFLAPYFSAAEPPPPAVPPPVAASFPPAPPPVAPPPRPGLVRWGTTDQEANAVLDRAARGDTSALPAVRDILRDPNVQAVYGDVGRIARDEVIAAGAGSDLTAAEAMRRGAAAVEAGLLADAGGAATAVERLAAARAATGWVAVHVLEALGARRPPGSPAAMAIEKHLASAERRYQAALKAVMVLRRLRGPGVGVQVNVSAGPMVVDNRGG